EGAPEPRRLFGTVARGLGEAGHEVHRFDEAAAECHCSDGRYWRHGLPAGTDAGGVAAAAERYADAAWRAVRRLDQAAPLDAVIVPSAGGVGVYCLGDPGLPAILQYQPAAVVGRDRAVLAMERCAFSAARRV